MEERGWHAEKRLGRWRKRFDWVEVDIANGLEDDYVGFYYYLALNKLLFDKFRLFKTSDFINIYLIRFYLLS